MPYYSFDCGFIRVIPQFQKQTFYIPLCGDLDSSATVDLVDAVSLVNFVVFGSPEPTPKGAGDLNCDGVSDIVDIISLIKMIVFGSSSSARN